jgi:type IV pilus assembly protein PilM
MSSLPQKFGIDFGNHTIKVVELSGDLIENASLVSFGSHSTPFGVVSNENTEYIDQLAQALKDAVKDAGIKTKYAVASIPESAIFSRLIETPRVPEKDLPDVVYWEAKQYLPIPIDEVQLDYLVINKEDDESSDLKILIVAAPKNLVNIYVTVIKKAGFEPVALETEAVAISRAVSFKTGMDNAFIVDMGAQSTDISIMNNGRPVFSQSISTGSDALTKAIAADFGFEYVQAEEYKRNYGLDKTQLEGKIYNSLKPVMDLITSEIQKALEFFRSKNPVGVPSKIVIVGDGAMLPGLVVYFAESLSMEILLGNPWENIQMNKNQAQALAKGSPGYAVAVGIALKSE